MQVYALLSAPRGVCGASPCFPWPLPPNYRLDLQLRPFPEPRSPTIGAYTAPIKTDKQGLQRAFPNVCTVRWVIPDTRRAARHGLYALHALHSCHFGLHATTIITKDQHRLSLVDKTSSLDDDDSLVSSRSGLLSRYHQSMSLHLRPQPSLCSSHFRFQAPH